METVLAVLIAMSSCSGAQVWGWLGAAEVQVPTNSRPQPAKSPTELWTEALNQVALVEGATIVFDVNPKVAPPRDYTRKLGQTGMNWIAACCNRRWTQEQGVQVFLRHIDPSRKYYANHVAEFSDFVAGLTDNQRKRLLGDGLPLSELPEESRAFLGKVLNQWSTLGPGAALRDWSKSAIKLNVEPAATYFSESSRRTVTAGFGSARAPSPSSEETERALQGAKDLEFVALDPAPTAGTLKFEVGETITVAELVLRMELAFGTSYLYDKRLDQSFVYLKGVFDKPIAEKLLAQLTQAPAAVPTALDARTVASVKDALLKSDLAGAKEALRRAKFQDGLGADAEAFLAGNSMTLGELIGSNAELRNHYARLKQPFDTKVTLGMSLTLSVRTLVDGRWVGGVPLGLNP